STSPAPSEISTLSLHDALPISRMHHQLGRPRLEAVEQRHHARQEAGVALEGNAIEPVGVPRHRGAAPPGCHAPGCGERRLLEERPPACRPGRERLERDPDDGTHSRRAVSITTPHTPGSTCTWRWLSMCVTRTPASRS